jgi:hypothetical protein
MSAPGMPLTPSLSPLGGETEPSVSEAGEGTFARDQ